MAGHDTHLLERGAHYLIYIEVNRSTLHSPLPTLPCEQLLPMAHMERTDHIHGRVEHRSIKVTAVNGLAFFGARQVVRIERCRRAHGKAKGSREVVFAVTDLDTYQIPPTELAAHAWGHWIVENCVHHVRDVTFNEDWRRTRKGAVPVVLGCVSDMCARCSPPQAGRISPQVTELTPPRTRSLLSTESSVLSPYGSEPRELRTLPARTGEQLVLKQRDDGPGLLKRDHTALLAGC